MSKQDIEKRLGFAAQGVKETTRTNAKAKFGRFSTEFGFLANQIKNQPDLAKKNIIVLAKKMGNESDITGPEFEQLVEYAEKLGMSSQVINAYDSVHPGFSRSGVKAKMAASDIIVKKDGQYIYYYPEDDDRATFPDDNGKGAYTVKSNRTGKPVSAKTYRSIQEAAAASNEMNEKLPPLKKAKASRPGAKEKMGFLSRVGYAATALTADPADPKSPEYRKQVSEAKAAAKDAITNYKFMRDKVKERLAALDAYVTNAIKVINSATSAKDIEHYVEQLRIAVKSQSMILGASKSPFSRAGAKAKFGLSPSEIKENQRRIETNIRYEAGVIRDVSSNMRFIKDEIQRLTAEIKNTRDIKRKAQLSLKLDAENKKMKDQVAYLRRARQMIQENQADAKSLGITLDAKWSGNFARPGVKAKA